MPRAIADREEHVAGDMSVATGVTAVSLNLTATNSISDGYVTAYPCGTRPLASHLDHTPTRTTTHLLADINGWYA